MSVVAAGQDVPLAWWGLGCHLGWGSKFRVRRISGFGFKGVAGFYGGNGVCEWEGTRTPNPKPYNGPTSSDSVAGVCAIRSHRRGHA